MKVDDYCKKLIVDHEISFATRKNLNDPFDCKVHLTYDKSRAKDPQYLRGFLDRAIPPFTEEEKDFLLLEMLRSELNVENSVKRVQEMYREDNSYGLLCLSEKSDSTLLWSLYANKHQGVCVRFLNPEIFFNDCLYKVDYVTEFLSIDAFAHYDSYHAQLIKAFTTKAIEWTYEYEWRVIVPSIRFGSSANGYYTRNFPERFIDKVILGSQISEKDKKAVRNWAVNQNMRVVRAEEVEGKPQLQIPE